ncbi:hypothetical protein BCh11DRAFT_06455 [Burkholderia sp. Ch1-1]|nr:hypothetical protein BCh11DRAFT_06455 [Burkholderia sp. Ch1-1]
MNELPNPLTPADCELREFPFMPLEVKRLLSSETWVLGTGDERAAAITLWLESWHQVPAASLPDNDRMLAHLSQSKTWKKSREHALRGWVRCSDGRLYHAVVAEKALEAWLSKLVSSLSGSTGNAKRWGIEVDTESVRTKVIQAVELLRAIAPQSEWLVKKQVKNIVAGSPPESPPDDKKIAPRSKKTSPPESPPDRNREGEGEGVNTLGDSTHVGTPRVRARPAEISAAMRRHGIEAQPADPRIIAASEAGYAVETIEAACAEAKAAKPNERISPLYVLRIAERWTADAAAPRATASQRPASHAQTRDDSRRRAAYELTTVTVTATPDQQHAEVIDVDARRIG